jgi:hypothetical protein
LVNVNWYTTTPPLGRLAGPLLFNLTLEPTAVLAVLLQPLGVLVLTHVPAVRLTVLLIPLTSVPLTGRLLTFTV